MAKGGRPDKENMIVGMFSKIAREYDRQKERDRREAKRSGEFYYREDIHNLTYEEQEEYFAAKLAHEHGGNQYSLRYKQEDLCKPYHFMKKNDG